VARARREDVVEGQRRQGRESAGAAAANRHPPGVDEPLLCQILGGVDAIVDVDDAPVAIEPAHVLAAVAVAAAVIDVDDGNATAREHLPVESEGGRGARGCPARRDDERQPGSSAGAASGLTGG
jgi:hypothetical protein